MDLESFVKTALGDGSGNPIQVGRSILDDTGTPLNLPHAFGSVGNSFSNVSHSFSQLSSFLGIGSSGISGIGDVVKLALGDFTSGLAGIKIDDTPDGLAAFLQEAITLVFKFAVKIIQAVQKVLTDTSQGNSIAQDAFDALGELIKAVLNVLVGALGNVQNTFPVALTSGPLDALSAVSGIGTLLYDLKVLDGIRERVDAVGHSLEQLFKVLAQPRGTGNDQDQAQVPFLLVSFAVKQTTTLLKDLLRSGSPEAALQQFIKDIVFPTDAFIQTLKKAQAGKLWAWAELPSAVPTGMLNRWLNNPQTYQDGLKPGLERDFRVRLVAAADAYIRNLIDGRGQGSAQTLSLTPSDSRNSGQGLADIVCIFLDVIFQFALEPDCFPLMDIDLYGIEDLGIRFGTLLAREIRLTIRALIGLVLRGFWEFSIHNEVLIEFIGVVIAAFFSAMIEAVIRNLTWSLQIVSCYPGDLFITPPPPDSNPARKTIADWQLVYYWPSGETVENSGREMDRLWYIAVVRSPAVQLSPEQYPKQYQSDSDKDPKEWRAILGLLRDFGAYIDVCYRRFRIDTRFPQVEAADEVSITRAELAGDRLTVWATTTATFEVPQPVLRAYFCCQIVPLRPWMDPAGPYTLEVDVEMAPRCVEVIVLSNRGGVARRRAVRA